MALLKTKSCLGLNLSRGCTFFGLIDLIFCIAAFIEVGENENEHKDILKIFQISIFCFLFLTCVLMIIGSLMKNRWFIVPHFICKFVSLLYFFNEAVFFIIDSFGANLNRGWIALAILVVILAIRVYYCIIMYSRYHEIRNNLRTVTKTMKNE